MLDSKYLNRSPTNLSVFASYLYKRFAVVLYLNLELSLYLLPLQQQIRIFGGKITPWHDVGLSNVTGS